MGLLARLGACIRKITTVTLHPQSPHYSTKKIWRHGRRPIPELHVQWNGAIPFRATVHDTARQAESKRFSPCQFPMIRCTCHRLFRLAARSLLAPADASDGEPRFISEDQLIRSSRYIIVVCVCFSSPWLLISSASLLGTLYFIGIKLTLVCLQAVLALGSTANCVESGLNSNLGSKSGFEVLWHGVTYCTGLLNTQS